MTASGLARRGGRTNVPVISSQLHRRGNWFMRTAAIGFMKATGWKFSGEPFPDLPKFVLIVAPHTSNWDFLVGLQAMYALGIQGTFLAKDSLFKGPLGILMRWLGGVPVDRSKAKGDAVTQTVEVIREAECIIPVVAPEGTRKASRWKTGFYWIAHKAGVPILPVAFDYSVREVRVFPLFHPTGDVERDLPRIRALYGPQMAKFPEQFLGASASAGSHAPDAPR
jgi:1-acyl-sn-glycerol-3-phosphate acyltransferase